MNDNEKECPVSILVTGSVHGDHLQGDEHCIQCRSIFNRLHEVVWVQQNFGVVSIVYYYGFLLGFVLLVQQHFSSELIVCLALIVHIISVHKIAGLNLTELIEH